jgi:cobalt-zinc-cadmium efflux system membrane fusion protein
MQPTRSITHLTPLLFALLPLAPALGCASRAETKAAAEPPGGAVTLWTDSTELFMEHPALIVGAPDKFAVHLTDLSDFAPLRSGKVTLRFEPKSGGRPLEVTQDAPRSPGIYGPAPSFSSPGVYRLTIAVESPQVRDTIHAGDLQVYRSASEIPPEQDGGSGGIRFLKEQQWKTPGFRTAFADTGTVAQSFQAPGEIIPAGGRLAVISAPIAGLIEASGVVRSPVPGERITKGDALAVLTPVLGEGGSSYAEARAALREAEDEYARAQRLYQAEAVPQRRVHEAEIRLTAAREALTGLVGSGETRNDGKLVIRSPIAGVVASRRVTPGSRVEAGTELFTVVDPSIVWVEVHVPASQASRVRPGSGASIQLPGSDRLVEAARMISVGSVVDSLTRTVPALYELANRDGTIKVGTTVQVQVRTGERERGLVIPASAVLEEDGRPIAFVQVEGESFERRALEIAGTDGQRALVRSGIRGGERVVTGAAYQVRLASLSTSVPAHGHEH